MSDQNGNIKKISAGGLVYCEGKYLLIKWASESTFEIPKGTVEKGESYEEACIRELKEETGYNVRILEPLTVSNFIFKWHDGKTYDKTVHYFLLERTDKLEPVYEREANEDFENVWMSPSKAESSLSFEDMKLALRKANEALGLTS